MKKVLFIILFLLLIPQTSEAARLWSSGAELQSVTTEVEFGITGSPTIDTTTKRSGAASLRCNPTAATAFVIQQYLAANPTVDTYVRFYLYITTSTDALDIILELFDTGSIDDSLQIRLNSNRTLELWDGSGPAQLGSDSSALNTGQWYRIEASVVGTTYTGYIDGVQFATGTMANPGFGDDPNRISVGCITATTADLYFDDIAVNDSSGTVQTGLPGAGSIVHMHPDSAGDAAATTGLFSAVDEVTPNDATDYVEQDTIAAFNYNFEASSVPGIGASDAITLVQIGTRQHPETAAAAGWTPQIKSQSGGTTLSGSAVTHNDTTWKTNGDALPRIYQLTSYTDPQAGGAWTPALLDTMIAGLNVTDATPNLFVSTLWALVEYVPSVASVGGGADEGIIWFNSDE